MSSPVEQRAQFKEHLSKVAALVGGLDPDFADRVLRFETKLAQIEMKPDQAKPPRAPPHAPPHAPPPPRPRPPPAWCLARTTAYRSAK